MLESWAPIVALGAVAFFYASLKRPAIPVFFAFIGIMLDARGMTSLRVLGLPVTIGKISVLYALIAHLAHRLVHRDRLFHWMPTTPGFFAILMTMLLSLVTAVDPTWGYPDVMGVIMLIMLIHLVYDTIDEQLLPWLLRYMAGFTVLLLFWTLLTQRKQGFFVTLDHAWQQRTSGAYGDPNAWCTALLVVCPILIGAIQSDKHWSSTPLLIGLLATFPACILQSMSRAGLIATVLVSPGIIYLLRKRKSLLVVGGLIVLASLPMFINLEAALLRYRTLIDPTLEADLGHGSLRERKALLDAGIQMFLENPVLGVGVGLFRVHASYVSAGEVWKIAHNSYLNVAAEQGVPGIVSHLYLAWLIFKAVWHAATRSMTPRTQGIGVGLLVALGGYCLMAFTLNLNTFAIAYYMLGFSLMVTKLGGSEQVIDRLYQARRRALPTRAPPVAARK